MTHDWNDEAQRIILDWFAEEKGILIAAVAKELERAYELGQKEQHD